MTTKRNKEEEKTIFRITLDEQDFKDLTAGKEVTKEGVKIIQKDIGHYRMLSIIESQMETKLDKPDKNH